ncbi:hypothetical protein [Butyrivibrio fibrisolvens]|jgi:hypothetical protein|uniref:hypothetical protein n=1 Tax=Butyrivibrio fibrisolvens TaxID=831 RepID=UPI0003B52555|nr:hypothetical protein [Butyrivibrio fibrisolvens]
MIIEAELFEKKYKKKNKLCIVLSVVNFVYAILFCCGMLSYYRKGVLEIRSYLLLFMIVVVFGWLAFFSMKIGVIPSVVDYSAAERLVINHRLASIFFSFFFRGGILLFAFASFVEVIDDFVFSLGACLVCIFCMFFHVWTLGNYRYGMFFTQGNKVYQVNYTNKTKLKYEPKNDQEIR